jgi:Flp pilus assembly protein CpaB
MKQKNLILMVVAVGCGLVAAFLTTQINAKPKVEQVEVWVATKDLPVGTMLTPNELAKLATKKLVAKEALPPAYVIDEKDLLDKRLTRPFAKDEPFVPGALVKGGVITLPEGKDMASLPMTAMNGAAGFIGPGTKVDVLATVKLGNKTEAFPLLIDMLVLAVDTNTSYDTSKAGVFPNMSTVSFAVTQEEALLLSLAKKRDCHLELLLRNPSKPVDPSYDIKKIKKLLEDEKHPTDLVTFEKGSGDPEAKTTPETPVAATVAKPETVKVLVATADIAPNTDITKDLIAQKFTERELPKELAEGAITDFGPHLTKAFKLGVAKGQWATESMIGTPAPKPAPQDSQIDNAPKPEPTEPVKPEPAEPVIKTEPVKPEPKKPEPKKPAPARATQDIYGHTASGTVIYRYEEVRPGDWKLKQVLTPEEAAQQSKKQADNAASEGK